MPHADFRTSMAISAAGLLLIGFVAPPTMAENFSRDNETVVIVRPRVRIDARQSEEADIRGCLSDAAEAVNAENLEGFVNCFTGITKSKIRKQAAICFVQHDVVMELLDTQILKVGKTTGEVAVKYRLVLTEDRFDVVSLVAVKYENGYWRIKSEKIQSYEHQSPSMCSPSRYACLGATCRIAAR